VGLCWLPETIRRGSGQQTEGPQTPRWARVQRTRKKAQKKKQNQQGDKKKGCPGEGVSEGITKKIENDREIGGPGDRLLGGENLGKPKSKWAIIAGTTPYPLPAAQEEAGLKTRRGGKANWTWRMKKSS